MANTVVPYIDPALLTQQAIAGSAQILSLQTSPFWAQLFNAANSTGAGVDTLDTTGANISIITGRTDLKVSGTMAFTLPNGTYEGQLKIIECISAAATPACTVTITTPDATAGFVCAGSFFFDTVGQRVTLRWMSTAGTSAWRAVEVIRVGGTANNVVVGTTVLTGLNLWGTYYLSVTGTVSSTTTKGIPNGSAVGEIVTVSVSTAASSPSGTISLTALTLVGGASTTLGTVGATGNTIALRWNGSAWTQLGAAVTLALS